MSNQNQNDLLTLIIMTLVGGGLYLLFNRQQTQSKKNHYYMNLPVRSRSKEYAHTQAILKYAPHTLGGSIISLN